jgi:alpha-galactosidase
MGERWLYLRGGECSFALDARPGDGRLPRVVHFGGDLGPTPDFDAMLAAAPKVTWGARLDVPRPPCVLPGLEAGYFGAPAVETAGTDWIFDRTTRRANGFTLGFTSAGGSIEVDYDLSFEGVLATRVRSFGLSVDHLAAALVLPQWAHDALWFGGDWAREFVPQRQALSAGALLLESRRGRPGHDRFPGVFIGGRGFADDHGDVYGVTLGWSGSHRLLIERLREGDTIVQGGALGVEIAGNYESPPLYAAYSPRGLNGVMQAFHAFVRARIAPNSVARRPRPVHYNTWEAVYFRHDVETLKALAERAAAVGAERFVLDDGWFKGRNDDRAGLGDWLVDGKKYPQGLTPLIEHARKLGLTCGLWVEPEMVNPDSDLARAHPDWLRREGAGAPLLQRHQAVLDIARPEVGEHLFAAIDALLSAHPIDYLKWDMNRDVIGPEHGAYVRALHALIDRLRAKHPAVEIESCASGGGRCDWAMLARAERVWVSDSNDALDRFDIQRNANLFIPPEMAGVHVGPEVCHITGRRLSLDLRAHVAMFGHMGLELDLRELSESEVERLARHAANYKAFRALIHSGRYWRLALDDDHAGIAVSADDGREALVLVVRMGSIALGRGTTLRLKGLSDDTSYRVAAIPPMNRSVEQNIAPSIIAGALTLPGRVLSGRGIELHLARPETSLILHFVAA